MAILTARRAKAGHTLYYFGLTGPEMRDVLDWRSLLHRDVTAVEEITKSWRENVSRMIDVGIASDLNVEVLRGKVEDVITEGRSADKERPRRSNRDPSGAQMLFYDLVNLDFDGGIGGVLGRHRAVEALLRAQAATPFTLFITYNVRHRLHHAIGSELANLRQQVGLEGADIVDWYDHPGRAQALRLKAVVPAVVSHAAATALLDCRAYPPIRYAGAARATLVHFAFDLEPRPDVFRAHHAGMRDLMTLPLLDAVDGALRISADQDPGFDHQRCTNELDFLPATDREVICAI